jgi:hypothetical protein
VIPSSPAPSRSSRRWCLRWRRRPAPSPFSSLVTRPCRYARVCVCVLVSVCVRVRVCARVRACMGTRACVRACAQAITPTLLNRERHHSCCAHARAHINPTPRELQVLEPVDSAVFVVPAVKESWQVGPLFFGVLCPAPLPGCSPPALLPPLPTPTPPFLSNALSPRERAHARARKRGALRGAEGR